MLKVSQGLTSNYIVEQWQSLILAQKKKSKTKQYLDQWSTKRDPKINPHSCGHIIFNKDATNTLGKESAGKTEHPPAEDWGESCVS